MGEEWRCHAHCLPTPLWVVISAESYHPCGVDGAVQYAPRGHLCLHLGRFLPKLGGPAKGRHFFRHMAKRGPEPSPISGTS
jgi:hypothetical protein